MQGFVFENGRLLKLFSNRLYIESIVRKNATLTSCHAYFYGLYASLHQSLHSRIDKYI